MKSHLQYLGAASTLTQGADLNRRFEVVYNSPTNPTCVVSSTDTGSATVGNSNTQFPLPLCP